MGRDLREVKIVRVSKRHYKIIGYFRHRWRRFLLCLFEKKSRQKRRGGGKSPRKDCKGTLNRCIRSHRTHLKKKDDRKERGRHAGKWGPLGSESYNTPKN